VKQFDEILRKLWTMLRHKQIAQMDLFLHELCEDTPYIGPPGMFNSGNLVSLDDRKNNGNY